MGASWRKRAQENSPAESRGSSRVPGQDFYSIDWKDADRYASVFVNENGSGRLFQICVSARTDVVGGKGWKPGRQADERTRDVCIFCIPAL